VKTLLKLIREFFNELNEKNVEYCHFKSNIRLSESVNGITDLDLLVSQNKQIIFKEILHKYSIKQIIPPKHKDYKYIEHYVGFDEESGKIVHFHVHYRFRTGKHLLKDYFIPLEDILLCNAVYDDRYSIIKIPPKHIELAIFIMRIAVKTNIKQIFKNKYVFPKHIHEELDFLIKNTDLDDLKRFNIGNPKLEQLIYKFVESYSYNDGLSKFEIVSYLLKLRKELKPYKQGNFTSHFIYIIRKLKCIPSIIDPSKGKKTIPTPHPIFAFVGAPGAGKSSTVKHIKKWLSFQIATKSFYMGLPIGNIFSYNIPLLNYIFFNQLMIWLSKIFGKNSPLITPFIFMRDLALSIRWICVAKSRLKLYGKMKKYTMKGYVVLCDRFPIKEINYGMKDPFEGPKLKDTVINKDNKLVKYFINKEIEIYDTISNLSDHFIIVLDVDTDVAVSRGRNYEIVKRKNYGIKLIDYNKPNIVKIDANKSHDEVIKDIKKIIWELL